MFWVVIIIISFVVALFFSFSSNSSDKRSKDGYYTSGYNIWLETKKGFTKFELVGMYYRKLKRSDMGKFSGYAKAEKNNPYDTYAVAIYNNYGKHLGYLPRGNKSVHSLILENNGSLPSYGFISCDSSGDNFTGKVAIKTNTALNTDNPFYDQNIAIVGRFDISQKELSDRLNKLGAYICGSVHENTDILLIGENMKSSRMVDNLELLNKNGCNIRAIYKDELNKILDEY